MSMDHPWTRIGALPRTEHEESVVPVALTRLVWLLALGSGTLLVAHLATGTQWTVGSVLVIDGLTVVTWLAVTGFSGIVHTFARRSLAGTREIDRFFGLTGGFTLAAMLFVAADHLAVLWTAWVGMGLLMAALIAHRPGWPEATAAAGRTRRSLLAGSAVLAVALGLLWWETGATTVSGVAGSIEGGRSMLVVGAAAGLLLAAMVQSALLPFQGWLLSSMTAPTPASALMHAGFVNAGGILLVRFSHVIVVEPGVMLAVVVVGAAGALGGKLLKSVQVDVKTRLGGSTVGQMGFMIMQVGLGFFAAAITHLVLHGCYKAYLFLGSGSAVERTSPKPGRGAQTATGFTALLVTGATALAGGVLFAWLTGKGTALDGGLLLTGLVVLTTMHASKGLMRRPAVPTAVRYGAGPVGFLVAIAIYAGAYRAIEAVLAGTGIVEAPAELRAAHGLVALAFVGAYLAIETGVVRRSTRLYVALVNAGRLPARGTDGR